METKRCSKCGRELPVSEFSSNKSNKDGLRKQCKSCDREYNNTLGRKKYMNEYYEKHKDIINERSKKYEETHKDKRIESHSRYYKKNRDKITTYNRNYNKKHIENLSPQYIRHILKDSGFSQEYITPDLIAFKRAHLQLKREIKAQQSQEPNNNN